MNLGRAGRYIKVLFIIGLTGHVVTVDDELPGGWSNPDGDVKFPWFELAIKALVLLGLMAIAFLIPTVRKFGT